MNPSVADQVVSRLKNDYAFRKENGDWLQEGTCPSCGKRDLFTRLDNPWVVRCGRENKCGWEGHVKDLYPDVFENFNARHKPTQENPNATADAYLRYARGFDTTLIKGWYEQGKWWHTDADRGTATVRFYVDAQRTVYMERFVEEVTITDPETKERKRRKAHFRGSHKGLWWQPPGMVIEDGDEVYIVEACLDAVALWINGVKAVATLSCVNFPDIMLAEHSGKNVTWIWALDNDKAGRKYTRRHVERMRADGLDVGAAQVPGGTKRDWNDLHQRGQLTEKDLDTYRYHGSLLIAESANAKALLMFHRTERREFHFEYRNRLYWFKLNLDRYDKVQAGLRDGDSGLTEEQIREQALKESGTIVEIANCNFIFLYFQASALTDESWYYARIDFPHGAAPVKNTFSGGQVASASEFKKRLLSVAAGSVFTGAGYHLDRILKDQMGHGIKTVQTIDFVGYSKEHAAYVYNDVAVKDGNRYTLNDEDFFECGKLSIKTLNQSVHLSINADREQYRTDWAGMLHQCFGAKGVVALAFWFGSLFAEQIRDTEKSFPFIEIIGEPGAGKSTLIEFLWKLVGRRDYEGFDPSKSTLPARARNFSQVSNLPVVLIEGDRDEDTAKSKRFDWDELKTAYNGRSVRSRGMKTGGNETYEPPFRGTIVISQNAEVSASEAILQRIIHLRFNRAAHTPQTKSIAERLERMPLESVSHFMLQAIARERDVMATFRDRAPRYERELLKQDDLKSVRIAKNHAQLMALVDALSLVVPLSEEVVKETRDTLTQLAIERQRAINADHPIVAEFWETFDFLNGDPPRLDHSHDEGLIAVNLNHFVQVATERKQQIPPLIDLKRHLKTSKARKYKDQRAVASAIFKNDFSGGKTVKCWVFGRD